MSPFIGPDFENMLDPGAVDRVGRKITDAVGNRLTESIRRRTPISTARVGVAPLGDPLDAFAASAVEPLSRRDRAPGSLLRSISRGPVRRHTSPLGRGWRVIVGTNDPIAPYVEDDTPPHEIGPTAAHIARARAAGKTPALAIYWRGAVHFFRRVWHPGTRGRHMFARGTAWTATEVGGIAEPYVEEFLHDLTGIGHPRAPVDVETPTYTRL